MIYQFWKNLNRKLTEEKKKSLQALYKICKPVCSLIPQIIINTEYGLSLHDVGMREWIGPDSLSCHGVVSYLGDPFCIQCGKSELSFCLFFSFINLSIYFLLEKFLDRKNISDLIWSKDLGGQFEELGLARLIQTHCDLVPLMDAS